MGLAYDLNTAPQPSLNVWFQNIVQGSIDLIPAGSFPNNGRNTDITFDQNEFDIIIRDSCYVQDHYVFCGSYRAFFKNLNGGAGAYAWDGFVTIIRAHNLSMRTAFQYEQETGQPIPIDGNFSDPSFYINPGAVYGQSLEEQPYSRRNQVWTYLCRMPYEVVPDLTNIGSDSSVGVYAVDTLKLDAADFTFGVVAGGHQRIDTATEGGLSDQEYSAWLSNLLFGIIPATVIYGDVGGPVADVPFADPQYGLEFRPDVSVQVSWKAEDANHVGRYLQSGQFPEIPLSLEDYASSVFQTKNTGDSVLLTNLGNGYYLTHIYDVAGLNIFPLTLDERSVCLTGQCAYDDGAGATDFTTPYVSFFNYESTGGGGIARRLYTPVGDRDFALDGDVAAYDLNGAYGSIVMPSFNQDYDEEGTGTFPPELNQVFIGVDNVTHGGSTNAEIYAANFFYVLNSVDSGPPLGLQSDPKGVWPFGVKGGPFETVGGFTLPDRWTGKAVQQRTYNQNEEAEAKKLSEYPNPIEPPLEVLTPGEPAVQNLTAVEDRTLKQLLEKDPTLEGQTADPINFLSGTGSPNIQQPGLPNNSAGAFLGVPANIAYGFIGYTAGVGPVIFMYDFGTVTMSIPTTLNAAVQYYVGNSNPDPFFGVSQGADILEVGDSMNNAIVSDAGDTNRRCISGQWDVDRDQWIFSFGLNGAGNSGTVLSCNSAFNRQPPNQVAYLDQTDQFINLVSDQRTSLYTPRNMTPYLDGIVLFGGEPDYTLPGRPGIPAIDVPSPIAGQPVVKGFQTFTISGTTGRTARVWTDYLLFDGVDSLVAVELQNLGLRVTVENVEWYKAKILRKGELGLTPEEIEDWVRSQQTEYRETLKLKERQGRLRTRRRQQAAWREGLEDTLAGDFYETTGFENLEQLDAAAETFVPDTSSAAPKSGNKSREHASIRKSRRDNKRKPE